MKKALTLILIFALAFSLFTVAPAAAAAQPGYFQQDYSSLIFNPAPTAAGGSYMGQYSVNITAVAGAYTITAGTLVFDSYQVTYVANPFTNEWSNAANYHKMNIKVPVSFTPTGGTTITFSEEDLALAPILFVNPWGGDAGSAVSAANAMSDTFRRGAMQRGWVVVEPGMRGNNTYSGAVGAAPGKIGDHAFNNPLGVGGAIGANFTHYGKLPNPIVDLKAALRYLRYDTNATTIPGDKEKIIAMGSSSGGCATMMVAANGNTHEYDAELDAIGAAPGRDDVWMAAPSCPVITRHMADASLAWMYFGPGIADNPNADPVNVALALYFEDYIAGLGLQALLGGSFVDISNYDGYLSYIWAKVQESMVNYLDRLFVDGNAGLAGIPAGWNASLRGTAAIDAYLASTKSADGTFTAPAATRSWIKPIYDDPINPTHVIGVDNTWEEYICYVNTRIVAGISGPGATPSDAVGGPNKIMDVRTDKLSINGTGVLNGNGAVPAGGNRVDHSSSATSFGGMTDYCAMLSDFGWAWYNAANGTNIPEEDGYAAMIKRQQQSVDPLYWIIGEGGYVDLAQNWFIRSGGHDMAGIPALFFNAGAALEMQGINVDAALTWDQGHGATNDVNGFFGFAEAAIYQFDNRPVSVTPEASINKLSGNKNELTITVTEILYNGKVNVTTLTFMINNNAADTYVVGGYSVYVDTKGNDQVRSLYIVE